MNYQRAYNSIIQKAKSENREKLKKDNANYVYYENHHILPKCLGGSNEQDNLVLLTAREHFVCHKLLTYIYKGNRNIACAFHYMACSKKDGKFVSSKDYEYAVYLRKNTPISEETRKKYKNINKGKKFSKEWKEHMKGNSPWNKGKCNVYTNETIHMMKFSHIGLFHTEKTKKQIGKSISGNKNGMYKKDGWAPIRNMKKICEYCKKEFDPGNYKKWHGEKCKLKKIDI